MIDEKKDSKAIFYENEGYYTNEGEPIEEFFSHEIDGSKVIRNFDQWAVTVWGLDRKDKNYTILKDELILENAFQSVMERMREKPWLDFNDFQRALKFAIEFFKK